MKVCESCVTVIDVDYSPSITVLQLKQHISEVTGYSEDTLALFFKGYLLTSNHTLSEYGVVETSTIHLIKVKKPMSISNGLQEVGIPLVDSSLSNKESSEEFKYNMSAFESISDYVYNCFKELPKDQMTLDEIGNRLISNPSILRGVFTSPLIQDILSDYNAIRHLLSLNPIILSFKEANPDLERFLQDDENIASIVNLLSDPASYNDLKYTQQVLSKMVSDHANRLNQSNQFNTISVQSNSFQSFGQLSSFSNSDSSNNQPEQPVPSDGSKPSKHLSQEKQLHQFVMKSIRNMLFHLQPSPKSSTSNENTTVIPNLWKDDSSSCESVEMVDREEHINLLCQVIGNKPDIVICYMKNTPLYKKIEMTHPGLINEIISPSRIALLSKPEVIRSIVHVDQMIEQFKNAITKKHT